MNTNWQETAREFLKQFIACTQKDPDCEGCRADLDAVIGYVQVLLEEAERMERVRIIGKFDKLARQKAAILGGEGYNGVPVLLEVTEVMQAVND